MKSMQDIDAVIHLAGLVGDPACAINGELTNEINYAATRMLIEVCKGAGVSRVLMASTCSVYGASEFLMDERSKPIPFPCMRRPNWHRKKSLLKPHRDAASDGPAAGDGFRIFTAATFRFGCKSVDCTRCTGSAYHHLQQRPVAALCARQRRSPGICMRA